MTFRTRDGSRFIGTVLTEACSRRALRTKGCELKFYKEHKMIGVRIDPILLGEIRSAAL